MFGSKYRAQIDDLEAQLAIHRLRYRNLDLQNDMLLAKWNALVERINELGGEEFLERGKAQLQHAQFDASDIRKLLQLCHPDKHGNSPLAQEMTSKLLAHRN